MSRGSKILAGGFAALYIAFLAWYGGHGTPLTPAERDAIFARIDAQAAKEPLRNGKLREELQRIVEHDDGNEFFMLNLIRYREKAAYPAGYAYGDDSHEADTRYNKAIAPYLIRHAAHPIFLGDAAGRFIDEAGDTEWQRVAIVRYRSRRDMLEMVAELAGRDVAVHKWASIEKTQVFPTNVLFSFAFVRGSIAALLAVIAFTLHFALRRAAWYRGTAS